MYFIQAYKLFGNCVTPREAKLWLETAGSELQKEASFTTITIGSEQKIAEIIRAFTRCQVDVFRIEDIEPSLEEMFLAE